VSVQDVRNVFARISQDNRIDEGEVDQVFSAVGTISRDEQREIETSVGSTQYRDMMDTDVKGKFETLLGEASSNRSWAASQNQDVAAERAALLAGVNARLASGAATQTFASTPIPEEVKTFVREALQNGATAYDVRQLSENPVYDTEHETPEMTVKGLYSPYPQEARPTDSMSFANTQLTPQRFEKDMSTVQTFNILDGYDGGTDGRATFRQVTQKGAGNVTTVYDEATWSDTMARASDGATHSSNFAILADGSVHAVPASRRYRGQPNLILTNPSLARGQLMLFNGHIEIQGGVVTYVGRSGRLGNREDDGEKFIDPLPLFKAWGFKLAPGLTVRDER
jgi:hypothetical protein